MKTATISAREFLTLLACLLATAIVACIVSMLVTTVRPAYGPDGQLITERTITLKDGHTITSENREHGWPVPYYQVGCWGSDGSCSPYRHVSLPFVVMNLLAWLAIAAAGWSVYIHLRRLKRPAARATKTSRRR